MPKFVLLWTDTFVFLTLLVVVFQVWRVRQQPAMAAGWRQVFMRPSAVAASVVLACFALIGVLDSVHYRPLLPPAPGVENPERVHSPITRSALDAVLDLTQLPRREKTYSAPLALHQFTKESQLIDGNVVRDYPRLQYAGVGLEHDDQHKADI